MFKRKKKNYYTRVPKHRDDDAGGLEATGGESWSGKDAESVEHSLYLVFLGFLSDALNPDATDELFETAAAQAWVNFVSDAWPDVNDESMTFILGACLGYRAACLGMEAHNARAAEQV